MSSTVDRLRERRAQVGTETTRIAALPRVPVTAAPLPLLLPGLHPVQSDALRCLRDQGGLLGLIGIGFGKSLINLLAGWVLGLTPKECLLLVPPNLVTAFYAEAWKWASVYPIVVPMVATYSDLSSPQAAAGLESLDPQPKLVMLDEGHYIRNTKSTRAGRLHRWLEQRPDITVMANSATLLKSSVLDLAVLGGRCLGDLSPLPRPWKEYTTAQSWSSSLDLKPRIPPRQYDRDRVADAIGACTLDAYHHNLATAPGVVMTQAGSCGASINMFLHKAPKPTAKVRAAVASLVSSWETPCGYEMTSASQLAMTQVLMECGFYYIWDWGEAGPDRPWLAARAIWFRAVRGLVRLSVPDLDSEALVTWAVQAYVRDEALLAAWDHPWNEATHTTYKRWKLARRALDPLLEAWAEWAPLRHRPEPPHVGVWVDDYLMRAATAQASSTGGILWYSNTAMWQWAEVHAPADHLVVRPGEDAPVKMPKGKRVVWMSVASHGTGLNLQYCPQYRTSTVILPSSSGDGWQQHLGRTHRQGQEGDELEWHVFIATPGARRQYEGALAKAKWLGDASKQPQKLCQATKTYL